jgi:hypothetical integral membrane protein (TIGR02206 family)
MSPAPPSFPRFGPEHDLALLVIAAVAIAAILFVRRASPAATRAFRLALATAMVVGSIAEIVVGLWKGLESVAELVPLQLCDLTLFLGAYTVVTLSKRTVEPLYSFAMSGTLAALVTPELPCVHVADFRFVTYFGLHGLTVVAAAVLIFGLRLVPKPGAWWRAWLWLNAYAAVVALVNVASGMNIMYLRAKPTVPTLFDTLGPWPWYLLSLEGVALGLFLALDVLLRLFTGQSAGFKGRRERVATEAAAP